MNSTPSFESPPVVETAISVSFKPLKGFGNAHLGLFWQQVRDEYPQRTDAEPIEPQEERFDGRRGPTPPRLQFRLSRVRPAARLQMASQDGHRMVQLQNGRLVYNWRRLNEEETYPRWSSVRPAFDDALAALTRFLEAERLGPLIPTQWEVTYYNFLLQGREWQTPADWPRIVPGIVGSAAKVSMASLESLNANWHYLLPKDSGRLHVDLFHGYTGADEDAREALIMQLTARGPIATDLSTGLELGHTAIVGTFAEITSEEIHQTWKRQR